MSVALLDRVPDHHARTTLPRRASWIRRVAFGLLFLFAFLLSLHLDEYGWDVAGCGVFLVCTAASLLAAARPCWVAGLFDRGLG